MTATGQAAVWKIVTDAHTAAAAYRKSGPRQVAETRDYQAARPIAQAESRRTSGRCTVIPPRGSLVRPETFANGISEG